MNHEVDASVRRGCLCRGRRSMLGVALAPAGVMLLQACAGLARPGGPAVAGTGAPVRHEPSAAEIRTEQAQRPRAQDAISARNESLLDTYWRLIELGERPVVANRQQREPHLILHREASRVSAYGGCNRLSGSYRLAQERLTFGKLVSTRMACEPGLRQEAGFAAVLAACAAWRVAGPHLELFDEAGRRVARFEVRHL